ncbi:flagellar biosynthesis anti-sigma factor FlgM [Variovorax dokdonensis]|uniref:Negative regulator of flagellin synthesis n=1 Tax=Variovorax dokdonensis TaxID=344883 RepID=A0ABT7N4T1_9BURK|nr:flagellar biosynthesis anti-sigma factor FlgM [Variovorax dokdonensis]
MKIDPTAPSASSATRPAKQGSAAAAAAADAAGRTKDSTVQISAQVHAMPAGATGGEFDAARVAAIREDIRAGRYQVNPERIASGLLDSVRSLLGPDQEKKE